MIDIKKAEASQTEVYPPLRGKATTESEVASSCAVEIRQSNKTGSDLGDVVHGGDVTAAASGRVRQIEQIDDEIRRAVEPAAIEYIPVGDLKPDPHNARKHPKSQIDLLAASIGQFGFVGVIIVDEGNVIISGHGRCEAAKRIGMDVVPCIRVTHLTAKAKIALSLADNRLGELSAWDELALTSQLEQLLTPDLDFDFEVTGFDTAPPYALQTWPIREPERPPQGLQELCDDTAATTQEKGNHHGGREAEAYGRTGGDRTPASK